MRIHDRLEIRQHRKKAQKFEDGSPFTPFITLKDSLNHLGVNSRVSTNKSFLHWKCQRTQKLKPFANRCHKPELTKKKKNPKKFLRWLWNSISRVFHQKDQRLVTENSIFTGSNKYHLFLSFIMSKEIKKVVMSTARSEKNLSRICDIGASCCVNTSRDILFSNESDVLEGSTLHEFLFIHILWLKREFFSIQSKPRLKAVRTE